MRSVFILFGQPVQHGSLLPVTVRAQSKEYAEDTSMTRQGLEPWHALEMAIGTKGGYKPLRYSKAGRTPVSAVMRAQGRGAC
jgi:hypothetical protein